MLETVEILFLDSQRQLIEKAILLVKVRGTMAENRLRGRIQGEMAEEQELRSLEAAFRSLLVSTSKTLPTLPPLPQSLTLVLVVRVNGVVSRWYV